MNILMVNSYYGYNSNGGAEKVCRSLAEEFVKKGHKVSVISIDSFNHTEEINGVNVVYIKTFVGRFRNRNNTFFVKMLLKLFRAYSFFDYFKYKKIIKKGTFDVVNTHAIEDITPVIWKAAHDCNVKIVHTMHDRYMLCYKLFMLKKNGELCCNPSLICKIRKVLYSPFYKMVDEYISPSKSLADDLGIKCTVIHNGVEIPNIENIEQLKIDREKILLFAGNLNRHKGINVLLDAFDKLDSCWKLYIAGEGELFEEISDRTKFMNNVLMLGHLDKTQMTEIYKKAFALVIPSIWKENCPMVILEAFSYGVPVIGSNLGGNVELINNGVNGYLFKNGDSIDLLQKIMTLNENYKKIIDNLNCSEYSIDFQANKYIKCYQEY